jgi:threonine dehydrogenase-like Zn-dependent dehydrogenase
MGVAGAPLQQTTILLTGLAGLLAGAISMALGEWLSVQSSREVYARQIAIEKEELETAPAEELEELALIYQAKGIVPDDLSDAVVAPINCALAQVIQGLVSSGFRQGDSLVVQGAGGLGLNMIAAARDMGAAEIIAVDGLPGRLKLAAEFGADHTLDIRDCPTPADRIAAVKELTNGYGATHVADVAGVRGVVEEGVQMLGNGGTYIEIGSIVPGFAFPLDPLRACRQGLRFMAFMHYDPRLLPRALNFVYRTRERVPWDRIISHTFPLEGINEAFERAEWVGRDPSEAVITRAAVTP